ncbi:MAG: Uridylate kinase [Lentisphaerae bacterium ADurb.Bin242]|nr:MAG: Uridylate kinase [Lentisphaerae bacterium ADurb.Bin242]
MSKSKLLYKRVLLKISGEALKGNQAQGYCSDAVASVVERVKEALDMGVEIALVVGAGNLWRGLAGSRKGMDRVTADYMGMLATAMNSLCLKDAFQSAGVPCTVHSAVAMEPFAERFSRARAMEELSGGKLVIFACGTGSPYFTTDTTAALRALETDCQAVMKATKVNGIYTADPMKDPSAKKFETLSFEEAVAGRYGIMDSAAFSLCADNHLHIIVFNFSEKGALVKVLSGDYSVGTVVR